MGNSFDTMKLYTSLILLKVSSFTYGQDTTVKKIHKVNSIVYAGIHNVLTPNLRSRLASIGVEKSAQSFYSFGLGLKYGQQKTFGGIDVSIHMLGSEAGNSSSAFLLQAFLNHKIITNSSLYVALV